MILCTAGPEERQQRCGVGVHGCEEVELPPPPTKGNKVSFGVGSVHVAEWP